jgi:glycosyltransferase involved in cell wall biosynthesis
MKILIVTAEPPRPPKNGVGRYVRDLKKSLGELAEVKVLSLQMDPFVQLDDEEIEKRKAGEYVPEFNSNPTKKLYFMDFAFRFENDWYSDTFEARHMLSTHHAKPIIKGVIAKFQPDIIYLNSMKVYWPFRYMNNLVIGFHAMTTSITGEEIYSSETMAMIRWEREVMERSLGTVVFSQKVKQEIIEKYNQKDNVHVLPLYD